MQRVGTVDKCFDVIEVLLSSSDDGMGIRTMARQLAINPTTVHNLCWTLCARGYLRQDPDSKRFKLAARFLHFAQSNQVWRSVTEIAEPIVERCREELNDSVLLAVSSHTDMSTLIHLPSQQVLRVNEPRLEGSVAYCMAAGKVLLSGLTKSELDEYFSLFPPKGINEGSSANEITIRRELKSVRNEGYATSCDEVVEGLSEVAIPILGPTGTTNAALGARASTFRMDAARTRFTLNTLRRYGEQISAAWFSSRIHLLTA